MTGGSEEVAIIVGAILVAIGLLGICVMDAIDGIKRHKRYVRNKCIKKDKRHL